MEREYTIRVVAITKASHDMSNGYSPTIDNATQPIRPAAIAQTHTTNLSVTTRL